MKQRKIFHRLITERSDETKNLSLPINYNELADPFKTRTTGSKTFSGFQFQQQEEKKKRTKSV